MFRIYLIILIVLLPGCQKLNNDTNDSTNTSDEVITDQIPFTDIPADTVPKEGKVEILSQISLSGQNLGLTTTANLGVNIGEAGRVTVSQANRNQWHTISFKDSYQDPIVIIQPLSYNAGDPSIVRIKGVTSNRFRFQITEWAYLDGAHGPERLSYLVLEKGVWALDGGVKLEVGSVGVNHNFRQVDFQLNFVNSPVVLTQVQGYKDSAPVTTRQGSNGNGFQVRLQEEQAADGLHTNERLGYVAISQGQEKLGNVAITAGVKSNVTHNFSTISFGFGYPVEKEEPIFLAGMQSYNGADPAALRYTELSTFTNTVKVRVEEEQSQDIETLHAAEDVGYLFLANMPPVVPTWTKQFGTDKYDQVIDLVMDGGNNIIIAGNVHSGGTANQDCFVRKYDNDGSLLWENTFGTSKGDQLENVTIDRWNNVIVTGWTLGALQRTDKGESDVFVRKYDSDGNILWTVQLGTHKADYARGINTDNSGNIFVTGNTKGNWGSVNQGASDAFLIKLDLDGITSWVRQFGTIGFDYGATLTVDSNFKILVAGSTSGSLSGSNSGSNDIFLGKFLNVNGGNLWMEQFGSSAYDAVHDIAIDNGDNIILTGYTGGDLAGSNLGSNDAFVSKYASNGNSLWAYQFGTSGEEHARGVTVDNNNDLLVTGYTQGVLQGISAGNHDFFLHKIDGYSKPLWFRQFGTNKYDRGTAISTDNNNNIILAGYTGGDLENNNAGYSDGFVRKYAYP